jgi:molecular chaperone DnaK
MPDNEINPVLGIDLGTTFSAIARWDGRGPNSYKTKTGEESLQSAVYYDPKNDEFLVGKLAYNKGLRFPENLAQGVKRHMDDASQLITIGGRQFTPVELSSRILRRLYDDVAEKYPNGRFQGRGTVVTVPYYFKAHQCANTRKAAEQADIECVGILQEPIAASLSYAWQLVQNNGDGDKQIKENILVFDLGGGTFDLTLFSLDKSKDKLLFEVLATGGDDRLGGMDFDGCLAELLLEKGGISLAGLSPHEERIARQKILEQAVEAKKTLSSTEQTYVIVTDIIPGEHIDTEVTRVEFETSIADYSEKIRVIIDSLWLTANIKPHEVNRVIRVGGSSRIPCMKELLDEIIGEDKVWGNMDPSLCVAEGAAMYSAFIDDREIFGVDVEIRSRTSHTLGVEIAGGEFFTMIPSNRKTPCEARQFFGTDTDDSTSLDINVYQGSSKWVKNNSLVGTLEINDLPKCPKELDIEVTFKVSEDQTLSARVCIDCDGGIIEYEKTLTFT